MIVFLFFKGEEEQTRIVQKVLDEYSTATGQQINPAKCSIMFGATCPQEAKDNVRGVLHIQQEAFESRYLGLPTPEGRMKRDRFQPLSARFGKRLIDWSEKGLSMAGKEVMIKSVAQALPSYSMGVFKLPVTFF